MLGNFLMSYTLFTLCDINRFKKRFIKISRFSLRLKRPELPEQFAHLASRFSTFTPRQTGGNGSNHWRSRSSIFIAPRKLFRFDLIIGNGHLENSLVQIPSWAVILPPCFFQVIMAGIIFTTIEFFNPATGQVR